MTDPANKFCDDMTMTTVHDLTFMGKQADWLRSMSDVLKLVRPVSLATDHERLKLVSSSSFTKAEP
jgi:hypothetical protein